MTKLIIDCEGGHELDALRYVLRVVQQGKICEAAGIPHYCWLTTFTDRTEVIVRKKKRADSADSFIVRKMD